jgi:hypothetical protein
VTFKGFGKHYIIEVVQIAFCSFNGNNSIVLNSASQKLIYFSSGEFGFPEDKGIGPPVVVRDLFSE